MRLLRKPAGTRALSLILPIALLVATGCSGGGEGADLSRAGGGGGEAPTTTVPQYFPLTGLQVTDPADAGRAAVTVKIENSRASRPQAGIDVADVVYESVVEGGQTRFLAIFQSADADPTGPIRSVRPGDPSVVSAFGGVVAFSGGIPRFVEAMRAAPVETVDENNAGSAFRRRGDRAAPHNLYTSTPALLDRAGDAKAPPPFAPFLKPGEPFAAAGATPVAGLTLAVGSTTTAGYDWDAASGTWKRSTDGVAHSAEGGAQIAPTTVIVQFVPYEATGESDTTGAPVTEAKVVGSGDAVVFAGGSMVSARWSKSSATAMTTWTDVNGGTINLPAGRTWVELPATGAALTTR